MHILLFGKNGQVGWELQRALAPLGRITAVDFDSTDYCGDFSNPAGVADTVRLVKPDVIVNAAAHTAVDKAESEREFAKLLNATSVAAIAKEAEALGAWLVHYSTDYVFDGSGERPYAEGDATAPLGVYGQSKRAGEEAIIGSGAPYLIFRTAWVYASHGRNFLRTMLRLGSEREQLRVVADQIGTPTPAALIADVTVQVLQSGALQSGIWHLTANGQTSWHGFAEEIFAQAHAAGLIARVPQLEAISTADYPTPARRPAWSVLDNRKLQQDFGIVLPDWQQGLHRVMAELVAARHM